MTAAEIVKSLGGKWCGSYGICKCVGHDDCTPSLKISDSDNTDDGIDVVCFAGCDWKDVKDEMRATGLLPEFRPGQPTRQPTRRRVGAVDPGPEKLANIEHAKEIWAASLPAPGTYAETYLRGRDITIPIPPTIRFAPNLKHTPSGLWLPVVVAAVTVWPSRDVLAVHRTFLKGDGTAKAPSSQAKMLLGPSGGGAVRLAPAAEEMIIAEGIETAMSVQQITGKATWAAISAGGITGLKLPEPPLAQHIVIAADNDDAGQQAAEQAAIEWIKEGRTVEISAPPQPGTDWNDVLQKGILWAA